MILWVDDDQVTGLDERQAKTNPVSDDVLWHDNDADVMQVTQTCRTAHAAFIDWAEQPFNARQIIVGEFVLLLESSRAKLTRIITKETEKPYWETAIELTAMINKIAASVKAYHARIGGQHNELPDGVATLHHRPYGVLIVFGPYNFPGHLPDGHIVPALLAGNALIFKPSKLMLQTGEVATRLWEQAGLPPGVLNLMQGGREMGQALSTLKDLDGLLSIDSANTGYQLHRQLSDQPEEILALKMGGNDPLIIEDPGDTDVAMHLAIQSALIIAGQHHACARRLLVRKDAQGNAFLTRLVGVSQRLVLSNWNTQPQSFVDRLTPEQAVQHAYDAWRHLALLGDRTLLTPCLVNVGMSLLTPGIIELTRTENVPDERAFGPLLDAQHYDSFDDAARLASNIRLGLSCGLVSLDCGQFGQLLLKTRTGIVG